VHRPAEVGDLNIAPLADKKVFRLDVSVNDILRVAVVQGDRKVVDVSKVQKRNKNIYYYLLKPSVDDGAFITMEHMKYDRNTARIV
jgi:hypothetical protein